MTLREIRSTRLMSHLILLKPSGSLSSAAQQIDVCPPGTETADDSPQNQDRGLCDTTIGSFRPTEFFTGYDLKCSRSL
jgi:hypothetical protein